MVFDNLFLIIIGDIYDLSKKRALELQGREKYKSNKNMRSLQFIWYAFIIHEADIKFLGDSN